ncbi:multiple epidermal growth factor-like domains protein 6 [Saccostrea cucullata]|uniref:multiple epidermal growth factor-like domains protein 6 n=1 Tax=Saccostrea cuccullata TaxID=36930 RepID=UPI002ED1A2AE
MATFIQIIFTFVLHHFLFGKLHARVISTGECPQQGTTDQIHCCPNFRLNGNKCEECPPGLMGDNCGVICPFGWYGRYCLNRCACEPPMTCDRVIGCTCQDNKCQLDRESTVSPAKEIPESTRAPDDEIETTIYHLITKRIGGKYTTSERNAQSSRSICTSNYLTSINHYKYITGLKTEHEQIRD